MDRINYRLLCIAIISVQYYGFTRSLEGNWNLWESLKQPVDRTKRLLIVSRLLLSFGNCVENLIFQNGRKCDI